VRPHIASPGIPIQPPSQPLYNQPLIPGPNPLYTIRPTLPTHVSQVSNNPASPPHNSPLHLGQPSRHCPHRLPWCPDLCSRDWYVHLFPNSHLLSHLTSFPEANITTLSRCDPAHGLSSSPSPSPSQPSASIEWPLDQPASPKAKEKEPVAIVAIDGRTEPSDLLFKKSIMGKSVVTHPPPLPFDGDRPSHPSSSFTQLPQVPASS